MIARLRSLARAYFAAVVILVFGALCFAGGVAAATIMAAGMVKAMLH